MISIDLELAWGTFDFEYGPKLLERARWTSDEAIPILLGQLEKNGLAATWAIVGFVMLNALSDCPKLTEVHYPHFTRPWLSYAEAAAESDFSCWFAPRTVNRIRGIKPTQEIGAHSLSHVIFGDPGTPRQRAEEELRLCQSIAHELGIELKSFVFPRNSIDHLDALSQAGFKCYRSPDVLPLSLRIPRGPALSGVACDVLGIAPRPVVPIDKNGLVEIPGSLMVRDMKAWRGLIPDRVRLKRLNNGLRVVAEEGGVYHIWLHPESLFHRRPRLEMVLAEFFENAGSMVRSGKLRCLTMGQLAAETQKLDTGQFEALNEVSVRSDILASQSLNSL
ncbi:MAG: hypothetical protein M3Y72_13630 [Acidobacteriota bacterium]|nr:hypothetical protein [Acidobacteriota bacterium]